MYNAYNESSQLFTDLRLTFHCDCKFHVPIGVTIFVKDNDPYNDPYFDGALYPYYADIRCFRCRRMEHGIEFTVDDYPNLETNLLTDIDEQLQRQGCDHRWSNIFITAPVVSNVWDDYWISQRDSDDPIRTHLAWCRTCRRIYKINLPKNSINQGGCHAF